MKTKVYVKEDNKHIGVEVKSFMYKKLSKKVTKEWQSLVNYITESIDCSVCVINVLTDTHIKEFIKSNSVIYPNRTYYKNKLLSGMFCETVIGKNKTVFIQNIKSDNFWKNSPEILFKTISYYGIPIKYSSGEFFGTLAMFGEKELSLSTNDKELMTMIRDSIEKDLHILLMKEEVTELSNTDPVTGLYNNHKIKTIIHDYQQELDRNISTLSVANITISNYKDIQSKRGEQEAEEMLILLARIMKNRARSVDRIGRLDTNKFIILSKGSTTIGQEVLLKDFKRYSQIHIQLEEYNIQFDYKITEILYGENIIDKIENIS